MPETVTIPLLPCHDIDEVADFYTALGFTRTHRQLRPNPYAAVERGDLQLHFYGLEDFDPATSHGTCLVFVTDTKELFDAFAEAMRATYGKILVSGIPRMTRPRKRKNTGNTAGFSIVDPGGNTIRIFPFGKSEEESERERATPPSERSRLSRQMATAVVLGESKGDAAMAATKLDAALEQSATEAPVVDLVEALVYRAELALRQHERAMAEELLDRVHDTELSDAERQMLAETLANAQDLAQSIELSE